MRDVFASVLGVEALVDLAGSIHDHRHRREGHRHWVVVCEFDKHKDQGELQYWLGVAKKKLAAVAHGLAGDRKLVAVSQTSEPQGSSVHGYSRGGSARLRGRRRPGRTSRTRPRSLLRRWSATVSGV